MTSVRHLQKTNVPFSTNYSAGVTGVHCAEAIFHLPELCTNTTVVASFGGEKPVRTARRYRTL